MSDPNVPNPNQKRFLTPPKRRSAQIHGKPTPIGRLSELSTVDEEPSYPHPPTYANHPNMDDSDTEFLVDENCGILEELMGKKARKRLKKISRAEDRHDEEIEKNKERRKSLKFTSPHDSKADDCEGRDDMRVRYGPPPKFGLGIKSIEDDLDLPLQPDPPRKLRARKPVGLFKENQADWDAMLAQRRKSRGKASSMDNSTPTAATPVRRTAPAYVETAPFTPTTSQTRSHGLRTKHFLTPPDTLGGPLTHRRHSSLSKIPTPISPVTPIKTAGAWHQRQVSANGTYQLPAQMTDLEKQWDKLCIKPVRDLPNPRAPEKSRQRQQLSRTSPSFTQSPPPSSARQHTLAQDRWHRTSAIKDPTPKKCAPRNQEKASSVVLEDESKVAVMAYAEHDGGGGGYDLAIACGRDIEEMESGVGN